MNIFMQVTLAAASLVLGALNTLFAFFIHRGLVDSVILQSEKYCKGEKLEDVWQGGGKEKQWVYMGMDGSMQTLLLCHNPLSKQHPHPCRCLRPGGIGPWAAHGGRWHQVGLGSPPT